LGLFTGSARIRLVTHIASLFSTLGDLRY
jgi:hypothetical protein